MDNSLRYFACAVGFGFGLVWMTVGLGPAILCVLLAALGYGAVFVAERARENASTGSPPVRNFDTLLDEFELEVHEAPEDATSPLAAEADYGWPVEKTSVGHASET